MNPNSDPSPQSLLKSRWVLSKKIVIVTSVIVLLALAAGVCVWAQKAQSNNTSDVVSQDDIKVQMTNGASVITAELPNGKTISYANTETNKNISWSSSSKGANYIDLSHKAIGEYLATVDSATITKLCGAGGELARTSDLVGTMSTTARMIEYPADESCLDMLATLRNTDAASRAKAAELSKQVRADIKQFYMTVIIK